MKRIFSTAMCTFLFIFIAPLLCKSKRSKVGDLVLNEYNSTTLKNAIAGVKDPNVRTSSIVLIFMYDPKHSQEDVLQLIQLTGNVAGYWTDDTALLVAVRLGYLSVVKYLLEQGADVNEIYVGTGPPLLIAIENRDLPMIRYLVEQGANIHQKKVARFFGTKIDNTTITPFERAKELDYNEILDFFNRQCTKKR